MPIPFTDLSWERLEGDVAPRFSVWVMTTAGGELKVGELARASGLSIRAVRYYDQIALLRPSRRSEGTESMTMTTFVGSTGSACCVRSACHWPILLAPWMSLTGICAT